jgi:hypothetical protein
MMYEETPGVLEALRRVRFMEKYFSEVVDADPKTRAFLAHLQCAYVDRLNEELAPHAVDLALAVIEWEDERDAKKP